MKKKTLGLLEGWLAVFLNLILFGLKLWAAAASGSVAMAADAWHTLSDSASSGVLIAGFLVSGRSPDERHPFGHGRAESIGAVMIATLLLAAGFSFLFRSAAGMRGYEPPGYTRAALTIFLVSAVLKEALARFSIWAGRRTGSDSLIADGWHHRSDAVTTVIVLAGIFLGGGLWWVDPLLGILVSVVIIRSAYGILKNTSGSILGEKMCPDIEKGIIDIIGKEFPSVSYPHHFHLHRYGDHAELTFHAHLPDNLSLSEAHGIVSRLEARIREVFSLETTIHPGPLSEKEAT